MLLPQELVRKAIEEELKQGDRFFIITDGNIDPVKILEYDIDEQGNAAFYCIEKSESKSIADLSIILCNKFEPCK